MEKHKWLRLNIDTKVVFIEANKIYLIAPGREDEGSLVYVEGFNRGGIGVDETPEQVMEALEELRELLLQP